MKAKSLMIQGTGSGVGKSVITAAFCRHFFKRGWKVAPFKAQNMSLNSFVTEEGGEMGRAQVFQAQACGLKPRVSMNPILLKPSGDDRSQVIVMGRVAETRNAKDYYAGRNKYIDAVKQAFDSLSGEFDLILLEGAGSPAEINLREFDFVNMSMAEMAGAPVLIVGDIDRGGVFAWMKGTYDLLSPGEQRRVGGFVINKFRGDPDLLAPGIAMFEKMVGKPVLGVIPFDPQLFVDEEDAVPHRRHPADGPEHSQLDIAVIQLPRISNFTDFSPLANDPSVCLRYIQQPVQLGEPHLIIIPGSKNTLDDLRMMNDTGFSKALLKHHRRGSILLGICAGFQMLGRRVCDPDHLESPGPGVEGLNLLNMETTLLPEKTTRQARRVTRHSPVFPEGLIADGYEIHMGSTKILAPHPPLFREENGEDTRGLGITNSEGSVLGTYLHGLLDDDRLRDHFLRHIRQRQKIPLPETAFRYQEFREKELDRLGKMIGLHLDMEKINALIEEFIT